MADESTTVSRVYDDKYSNPDGIHHYEITKSSGRTTGQGPNDYSYLVECNSDDGDPKAVSNREYEQRVQDKNRSIRLLNQTYLTFIEEFDNLIKKINILWQQSPKQHRVCR